MSDSLYTISIINYYKEHFVKYTVISFLFLAVVTSYAMDENKKSPKKKSPLLQKKSFEHNNCNPYNWKTTRDKGVPSEASKYGDDFDYVLLSHQRNNKSE